MSQLGFPAGIVPHLCLSDVLVALACRQVKKAEGMGIKWTAFLEDLYRNKDTLV